MSHCSTSLTPFTYHNHPVRTLQHADGTTWWVAADVCAVLEIRNVSQACKRLDTDERDALCFSDTTGRQQEVLMVNEPGLYKILLRSNKPEAKAFQRWVTHEVLPQIRQTGAYGQPPPETLHNPVLQALAETMRAQISMMTQIDHAEHRAMVAEATALRAEGKADLAIAEMRLMTIEDFVLINGLLRQLPRTQWPTYVTWLKEFCQAHGLQIRKDPLPGRLWGGENVYPITALGALLRYEQTRPRQVTLLHPSRSGI